MDIRQVPLKYWDERNSNIDMLIVHCSAHNTNDMIDVLECCKLSTHYIIGLEGEITQLVSDEKRAWHAGVSYWRGKDNLNHRSIGVEISSLSMGQDKFNNQQIHSIEELFKRLIVDYNIQPQNIVGHSDVAPTRKVDPGIAFPWKYLASKGIGLWYDSDFNGDIIQDEAYLLSKIGYNIDNLEAARCAFCRHFIPECIETNKNLSYLIEHPVCAIKNYDMYLKVLNACFDVYKNIDLK